MKLPAMDAVRSKRFGYLSTDQANIAIIMYDDSVPNRNGGDAWRVPRPVFVQSDGPVDFVDLVEDPQNYEKNNFSNSFWEEAAKIYRIVSPEYENTPEDTKFNAENAENEFETAFLNNIVGILNNNGVSSEIWNHVLEDAQWNRIEDNETGDVNLFGGEEEKTFADSEFKDNDYIPPIDQINEWGLYSYSWRHNGCAVDSLWVRFKTENGETREYPIIENLHGVSTVVSINPDFGSIDSNYVSESVLEALENKEPLQNGDSVENALVEMVQDIELSEKSQYFIQNATESTKITE